MILACMYILGGCGSGYLQCYSDTLFVAYFEFRECLRSKYKDHLAQFRPTAFFIVSVKVNSGRLLTI